MNRLWTYFFTTAGNTFAKIARLKDGSLKAKARIWP
jgi:hypothetical protein